MSSERMIPEKDPVVAKTYQALAEERVPDHLNAKVLRMAAREASTPYSLTRAWIRPLAWAATIALSLAIVLEFTQLPPMSAEPRSLAIPDKGSATPLNQAPRAQQTAGDSGIEAAADEIPVTTRQRHERASSDAFEPRDMAVLRAAEEMARAQAGRNQPPVDAPAARQAAGSDNIAARRAGTDEALAAASFSPLAEAKWPEADRPCPAAVREPARSWLACIAKLRHDGLDELADYESREFEMMYPNPEQ